MRSGLDVVSAVGPLGAAICAIDREGCEARNCFCSSPPNYWSYWKLIDGEWTYSQRGANSIEVRDGAVEGWTWGPGNPPPVIAFADVCAQQVTPTDTAVDVPEVVSTATSETPEPPVTQIDDPPPSLSPSGKEATPSPTNPPTPVELSPVPSVGIKEKEDEATSDWKAKPSASDDQIDSIVQPEPSPTGARPQATVVVQAEIQRTATTSPQTDDIGSPAKPIDVEAESHAQRALGAYIAFAVLTGGLVGLLILFRRR
jgi:hypothetical protein